MKGVETKAPEEGYYQNEYHFSGALLEYALFIFHAFGASELATLPSCFPFLNSFSSCISLKDNDETLP